MVVYPSLQGYQIAPAFFDPADLEVLEGLLATQAPGEPTQKCMKVMRKLDILGCDKSQDEGCARVRMLRQLQGTTVVLEIVTNVVKH